MSLSPVPTAQSPSDDRTEVQSISDDEEISRPRRRKSVSMPVGNQSATDPSWTRKRGTTPTSQYGLALPHADAEPVIDVAAAARVLETITRNHMQRRTSCTRCALPFDRPGLEQCAFVASFLSALTPKVGQAWWVPDLEEHALGQYAAWYKGTIVETSEDEITVQLDDAQPRPVPASVAARSTVPIGHHGDFTELLEAGRARLRGVSFDKITADMMARRGDTSDLYALSHPCDEGEVDWFISHSRGDNVADHYDALRQRAVRFKDQYDRWPTLWLATFCLPPGDAQFVWGVKLEMYCLMHIDSFFVLMGPSYTQRLRCVWQLFSRVALRAAMQLRPRVELIAALRDASGGALPNPQRIGAREEMMAAFFSRLAGFRLCDAACQDPNFSAVLHNAIASARGRKAEFERQVRTMVQMPELHMDYLEDARRQEKVWYTEFNERVAYADGFS